VLSLLLLTAMGSAAPITDPAILELLAHAPTAKDYPHTDAVWVLRTTEISLEPSGALLVTEHKFLKILSPEGLALANWEIPYDSVREVLEVPIKRTLVGNQAYPVAPQQVVDSAVYPGWQWYDALKIKRFPLPAAVVGSVLEVETVFRRSAPRMPNELSTRLQLQQAYPVCVARYTLRVPRTLPLAIRFAHLAAPEVVARTEGDRRVYRWTVRALPALKITEVQAPPTEELVASARVASLPGWAPVAAWYAAITAGKDTPTPAVRATAATLTAGCNTPEERVTALVQAVRTLPYVALEMGNLSDIPQSADAVLRRQFGDCKEKATLLKALLRAVGRESWYVLVRTSEHGALDRALYGPGEFNHVILAIPAEHGYHFLDPTLADVPATLLPPGVEGAEGLMIRGPGELVHLPVTTAAQNGTDIRVTASVLPDGSARGQATLTFTGMAAVVQRGALAPVPTERYREALEGVLAPRLGAEVAITGVTVNDLHTPEHPLLLTVTFTSQAYLQPAGPQLSGQLPAFMYQPNRFRNVEPRVYPYVQRMESSLHEEVTITLPDGWQAPVLPAPLTYTGPFGRYADRSEFTGNLLHYTCDMATYRGVFPPDTLDDLRHWSAVLALDGRNSLQYFIRKP